MEPLSMSGLCDGHANATESFFERLIANQALNVGSDTSARVAVANLQRLAVQYNFEAQGPGELSVRQGDMVVCIPPHVLSAASAAPVEGWLLVATTDGSAHGYVPEAYVKPAIIQQADAPPQQPMTESATNSLSIASDGAAPTIEVRDGVEGGSVDSGRLDVSLPAPAATEADAYASDRVAQRPPSPLEQVAASLPSSPPPERKFKGVLALTVSPTAGVGHRTRSNRSEDADKQLEASIGAAAKTLMTSRRNLLAEARSSLAVLNSNLYQCDASINADSREIDRVHDLIDPAADDGCLRSSHPAPPQHVGGGESETLQAPAPARHIFIASPLPDHHRSMFIDTTTRSVSAANIRESIRLVACPFIALGPGELSVSGGDHVLVMPDQSSCPPGWSFVYHAARASASETTLQGRQSLGYVPSGYLLPLDGLQPGPRPGSDEDGAAALGGGSSSAAVATADDGRAMASSDLAIDNDAVPTPAEVTQAGRDPRAGSTSAPMTSHPSHQSAGSEYQAGFSDALERIKLEIHLSMRETELKTAQVLQSARVSMNYRPGNDSSSRALGDAVQMQLNELTATSAALKAQAGLLQEVEEKQWRQQQQRRATVSAKASAAAGRSRSGSDAEGSDTGARAGESQSVSNHQHGGPAPVLLASNRRRPPPLPPVHAQLAAINDRERRLGLLHDTSINAQADGVTRSMLAPVLQPAPEAFSLRLHRQHQVIGGKGPASRQAGPAPEALMLSSKALAAIESIKRGYR